MTGPVALHEDHHGPLTGPFVQGFFFTVPGRVRSKSNHRHRGAKDHWGALAGYELAVTAAARRATPPGWDPGNPGDPVPARPVIVTYTLGRTMLDAGNLDKSILDALQPEVMVTDAQVAHHAAAVVRTSTDPGVLVAVARLDPGAGPGETATAAAALAAGALRLTGHLQEVPT